MNDRKTFQKILVKQGMKFNLGTKVVSAVKQENGKVKVVLEPSKGGKQTMVEVDVVLVSIGRNPYTYSLGLENVGIIVDKKGRIQTDEHFVTSVPSIRAIGDVIQGPM